MTNAIDGIVLVLLIYYFWRGWRKGFLGSLLGPISLIIGGLLSYSYYLKTENIVMSLVLSVAAPFVLHITLALLLKIWSIATSKDGKMSPLNRLLGSAFSVIWSGGMMILVLLLVMVIPGKVPYIDRVHQVIAPTKTYALIARYTGQTASTQGGNVHSSPMIQFLENPEKFEYLSNTEEFKAVMENSKVRRLLEDADVREHLQEKNVLKLMTNDKMKSLLEDKDLIKDFFALQKKIMLESMEDAASDNPHVPEPKVLEIENGI